MTWDEILKNGIVVEDIAKDSAEYSAMSYAAVKGDPSAQYFLGLWREKTQNKAKIAIGWYKKAALQNYKDAIKR